MVVRARELSIPAKLPRRYVEKFFTTKVMARKYKELYEELLARQPSPDQELAESESAAA
jgi:hypothetical protein